MIHVVGMPAPLIPSTLSN